MVLLALEVRKGTLRAIHEMMLVQGMTIIGDGQKDNDCGHYGVAAQRPATEDQYAQQRMIIMAKRLLKLARQRKICGCRGLMTIISERLQLLEEKSLAPYAMKSAQSKGREVPEEPDIIRTCFMRDRDRIIHSKSFRRLKHKTQVYISPENDHYRTRLTHTLEVSQISRTVGKALGLNTDLIEAIALGHDVGHTPFSHTGKKY